MSITRHHNFDYDGAPLIGIAIGDRYHNPDLGRDFNYQRNLSGQALLDVFNVASPLKLAGGVVTKGAGDTLNITLGVGYAKFEVTIPNSPGLPPTTTQADIEAVRVAWTAQTNMAILSAVLNGSTVNYVKVAYTEKDYATRVRTNKPGSYAYERQNSFVITVDSTSPTDYEILLDTFTGTSGGAFTFAGIGNDELNAHTVDSYHATTLNTANTLAVRDASKKLTIDTLQLDNAGTKTVTSLNWGISGTGVWSPSSNTIAFSINETEKIRIDNNGIGIGIGVPLHSIHSYVNSTNSRRLRLENADGSVDMLAQNNKLKFIQNDTSFLFEVDTALFDITSARFKISNLGTEALPARYYDDDPDTGELHPGPNRLAYSTAGVKRLEINTSSIDSLLDVNIKKTTSTSLSLETFATSDITHNRLRFRKSGGATIDSFTPTIDGDFIGAITFSGSDNSDFTGTGAYILGRQNGATTTVSPIDLLFYTSSGGGGAVQRLGIFNDGKISTNNEVDPDVESGGIHVEVSGTEGDALVVKDGATQKMAMGNDGDLHISGGLSRNGQPVLNVKILDMGNWVMRTGAPGYVNQIVVPHGLTFSKIRSVSALIWDDTSAFLASISHPNTSGSVGGYMSIQAAGIFLNVISGGYFDSTNFDTASFNRGYIKIKYTE